MLIQAVMDQSGSFVGFVSGRNKQNIYVKSVRLGVIPFGVVLSARRDYVRRSL